MKIAIIGVGAMGSVYAGLLADAGNEVWIVDLRKDYLEAIQKNGLRIKGASGDRIVSNIKAAAEVTDVGLCDLVIIATKAYGVESAARSISPLLHNETIVLTIQNGLGAATRICKYIPSSSILLGVAEGFGASIIYPGYVHHNRMELIRIGELTGGMTPRVEKVVGIWRDAGFTAKGYDDIHQLIWEKFICNVTFSAPCTVFNCKIKEILADSHAWSIARECGLEAYAVSQAKGITLSFEDPETYIQEFGAKLLEARPSMLLDHLDQRRSEIDAINGMVPIVGAEAGIKTPYNEVMTAIVRFRETLFDSS
ncbi:MAG: 2-dehydropantoate 2-reductase [Acidiferrobacteraceae bacterium]|nr:2-dehydropantoate 2-reductase [Acidiferrobacteraceae bacterium]|tara:strand:+ start:5248 stop:6177 length:930 start_codon:yes stop_codon:yes gene_type:complete